jgi:hypothetical protein
MSQRPAIGRVVSIVKPAEPSKADVALEWIASGLLRVHFDATSTNNVIVPKHLRDQVSCILEFGFDMPRPIPDLKVDQDGISGTLSFPGFHEWVIVHWEAVFAIASPSTDRVAFWLNDAPASVRRAILRNAGRRANEKVKARANAKPSTKRKHKLRLIRGGKT